VLLAPAIHSVLGAQMLRQTLYLFVLLEFFVKVFLKIDKNNLGKAIVEPMNHPKGTGVHPCTACKNRIGGNKEGAWFIDFNDFNV
jgi:hypothetical protein